MSTQSPVGDPLRNVALALGFLAVAASALVARANPATEYELSIYAMTPTAVWAGLLVALAASLAVAFGPSRSDGRATRPLAILLGGLGMTVFVGLPIVRGYRFLGHYDALTHLGWARAIAEGTIVPFDLYYPAIHTVTVFIHSTLNLPLSQSMLLMVLLAVLVFCTFVPLCVRTIVPADRGRAAAIGAFAAFLLLPITTISMFLEAHAMSQAVLFSALLVYLVLKYVQPGRASVSRPASAIGVALAFVSVATVVYHPQLVAHLIAVFLGICTLQFLARRVADGGRMAGQTTLYGHSLFLIGLFLVWISNYDFFGGMFEHFFGSAIEFLLEGGGRAADAVAGQGASLSAIGSSLVEIFFKLFTPELVFLILVAALALAALVRRNSNWVAAVRAETTYFLGALAALVPLFGIYFLAPNSKMHFRVFGLMLLFVTILGAVAIHGVTARFSGDRDRSRLVAGHPVVAVGFALLLVLSLVAVIPSPYIYKASPHVSDAQMNGYETAFENRNEDIEMLGLRGGPNRFDDAINGNEERMHGHPNLDASSFGTPLASQYDGDRYLALTQVDYERELNAYNELRYTEAELDSIATQPHVNRVQSNGGFTLYYVDAESTLE
ncbi:MFS transporter [Halopiger thermotolerans]